MVLSTFFVLALVVQADLHPRDNYKAFRKEFCDEKFPSMGLTLKAPNHLMTPEQISHLAQTYEQELSMLKSNEFWKRLILYGSEPDSPILKRIMQRTINDNEIAANLHWCIGHSEGDCKKFTEECKYFKDGSIVKSRQLTDIGEASVRKRQLDSGASSTDNVCTVKDDEVDDLHKNMKKVTFSEKYPEGCYPRQFNPSGLPTFLGAGLTSTLLFLFVTFLV